MALTRPRSDRGPAADATAIDVVRAEAGRLEDLRAVLLVEGRSDRAALRAAARVLGRDLDAERIPVVPMGGITNLVRFGAAAASVAPGVPLAVLGDGSEEGWLRAALPRLGGRPVLALCDLDLEDELLRALGVDRTLAVLASAGELAGFRTFQGQPAKRGRPVPAQLHRFLGVASGRKERMAAALTAALGPGELPEPFRILLAAAG